MQKIWYINQSGKNKGPFNAQDIIDFYDKGLIKSYQLCWRQGAKSWKPVFAVIQVARDEALSHYEQQVLGTQDPLPEIPIHEVQKPATEAFTEEFIEQAESYEEEALEVGPPSKFPIYTTVIASFFISIVILVSLYTATGTKPKEIEVKNISMSSLNELKRPVNNGDVTLIANKEMTALYAKLPFEKRVSVELILHRKADDLHRTDIMIKTHNIGEGGMMEFKDFVFEEGQNFIPGSYRVTFIYEFLGLMDNVKNKLGMGTNREVLEKKLFLVPDSREEYIARVAQVKKKVEKASKKNIDEISQKLRTLESIISSISIHYRLSLSQSSGWLAHKEFQQRYAKNVAPLLQSLILSNYDLEKKNLKPDELKLENEVGALGKDISAWSVKLTEKLSRYGMLNKKKRLFLRKFMDDDRVVFQASKNEIQKQIDPLL